MDEDRLSPDLGRLIDRAKGAAVEFGAVDVNIEAVALLTDNGDIYTAAAWRTATGAEAASSTDVSYRSAAHLAVERAHEAGAGEILAAALAAPFDSASTMRPSVASYERLLALDPELPLVLKQHGRWVMIAANSVTPAS